MFTTALIGPDRPLYPGRLSENTWAKSLLRAENFDSQPANSGTLFGLMPIGVRSTEALFGDGIFSLGGISFFEVISSGRAVRQT